MPTPSTLTAQLRLLLHPMLVHFPIALLFAAVALDWLGYGLNHRNVSRAGFYTLVLGACAAGIAALTGPDHAGGDAGVAALLADHQNFASLTVVLAVGLVAIRFFAADGLSGWGAALYLLGTLALLAAVTLTGYYGGEMTYHHAVGVTGAASAVAVGSGADVRPLLPAKPVVALVGLLATTAFAGWLVAGMRLFPRYAARWWQAVRLEATDTPAFLWTLRRRALRGESGRATGTAKQRATARTDAGA